MGHLIYRKNSQKGQSLVEVIVVMGLMAVLIPGLFAGFALARQSRPQTQNRSEAVRLLKEGSEAIRSIRRLGWANITTGTYYPQVSAGQWQLAVGTENVNGFERSILIEDVSRNITTEALDSAGEVDPSTKKATVTVSWQNPIPSSISQVMYLTRYQNNSYWEQSLENEFLTGNFTNTTVSTTGDGEILLDLAPSGGNLSNAQIADTFDIAGNSDAVSLFTLGNYAYVGTQNRGTDEEFFVFDISDPQNLTQVGSLNFSGDVNDIHVAGNYAYVASSDSSADLAIIDVSTPSNPQVISTLDVPSSGAANSLFFLAGFVYMGKDQQGGNNREFFVINVTNINSPSVTANADVSGNVNSIFVEGTYAYLATAANNSEVVVFNVSNSNNVSQVETFNLDSGSDATDVEVSGNNLFVTTLNNGGGGGTPQVDKELYVLDKSNPQNLAFSGSYDIGGDAYSVFIDGTAAYVTTGLNGSQLDILDISNISNISLITSLDLGDNTYDSSTQNGYIFTVGANNTSELVSIGTGSTSTSYFNSGTYESTTFDAGTPSAFNYVDFSFTKPSGTNVQFQIAVDNTTPPLTFFGPDGTDTTFYENPGKIYFPSSEGRYFRYKVIFTSDGNDTPVVESFRVNYSP